MVFISAGFYQSGLVIFRWRGELFLLEWRYGTVALCFRLYLLYLQALTTTDGALYSAGYFGERSWYFR